MNVLEKILEEIEERVNFRECLVKYEKRRGTITDVCRNKGALEELDIIAEIIRSHMDDEDNNGWIPVEERLPEKRTSCLVTVKYNGFMGMYGTWIKTGHLESDNDWWGDCMGGEVIAWRPLPESYKPKKDIQTGTEHIMSRFMTVE